MLLAIDADVESLPDPAEDTGLQYFLARALAKHGMKMADIEFVNLPVGDAQSAFLAGRVDAVVPSLNGRYFSSTQGAAIAEITKYVNAEQKVPTDEGAMKAQLLGSRFFDLESVRKIVKSDAFRAGLDDQVKWFVDTKQIAAPIAMDKVIAGELLG